MAIGLSLQIINNLFIFELGFGVGLKFAILSFICDYRRFFLFRIGAGSHSLFVFNNGVRGNQMPADCVGL